MSSALFLLVSFTLALTPTQLAYAQDPLVLTMTAGPDPVRPDERLTFTLQVTNQSTVDLPNVIVLSLVPTLIRYVDPPGADCPGSSCDAGETMTWEVGTLPAGQSSTLLYSSLVGSAAPENTVIPGRATATADGTDEASASVDVIVDLDPPLTPLITHVDPDPVTGSNSPQPFTIFGNGFMNGATVTLSDYRTAETFPDRPISSQSSTQITINPVFTTTVSTWAVEVINPDGNPSGEFVFEVVAPAGGSGVNAADVPTVTSYRMPIRGVAGDDLQLLDIDTWSASNYPKIRFNDDGDNEPDEDEWYVATAHNEDRNLVEIFGGQTKPYSNDGDFHPGEDWNLTSGGDADEGELVYAIADGVVLFNDCVANYGNAIIIVHKTSSGEFITSFYGHLENNSKLPVGESINKGDSIGNIGKTSDASCGRDPDFPAHLHFEIRKGSMVDVNAVTSQITRVHSASMWPASDFPGGDNGFSFIQENYYPPSEFLKGATTDVAIEPTDSEIPNAFRLNQNYPNPFNPVTTITFDLPEYSEVSLVVYDMLGRTVATLVSGALPAGIYRYRWGATGFPSGVYAYRLQAGSYSETKRMILLK